MSKYWRHFSIIKYVNVFILISLINVKVYGADIYKKVDVTKKESTSKTKINLYCHEYEKAFKTIEEVQGDYKKGSEFSSKKMRLDKIKRKLLQKYLTNCNNNLKIGNNLSTSSTCYQKDVLQTLIPVSDLTMKIGEVLIKLNIEKEYKMDLSLEYCNDNPDERMTYICNNLFKNTKKAKLSKSKRRKKKCEDDNSEGCTVHYTSSGHQYYAPTEKFNPWPTIISGTLSTGIPLWMENYQFKQNLSYQEQNGYYVKDMAAQQQAMQKYNMWWLAEAPVIPFSQTNQATGSFNFQANP